MDTAMMVVMIRAMWTSIAASQARPRTSRAHPLTSRRRLVWINPDFSLQGRLTVPQEDAPAVSLTRDMSGFGSTRSVRFLPEGSHAAGGQNGPDHRCDWIASSEEVEL